MPSPLDIISAVIGPVGLSLLFAGFGLVLFVYVMTRNYRIMIQEGFRPRLEDGEPELGRLDVVGPLTASRTVMTDRRVLQLRLGWLFSTRRTLSMVLADAHSVSLRRSLPWILIILAVLLMGRLNPVAFLILLWGLDTRVHSLVYGTPFAHMPLTRISATSYRRAALADFQRFYRTAQGAWLAARTAGPRGGGLEAAADASATDRDFTVGPVVWVAILTVMAAALLQRLTEGSVSFDSWVFGPLYLAAPVSVARKDGRDGRWVAVLAFVGLLSVKYPSGSLLGFLVNDGGTPDFVQYFTLLVTLLIMSEAAAAAARSGHTALGAFAVVLWLPWVGLSEPSTVLDLGLYSRVAAAVAVAFLGTALVARWQEGAGSARPA